MGGGRGCVENNIISAVHSGVRLYHTNMERGGRETISYHCRVISVYVCIQQLTERYCSSPKPRHTSPPASKHQGGWLRVRAREGGGNVDSLCRSMTTRRKTKIKQRKKLELVPQKNETEANTNPQPRYSHRTLKRKGPCVVHSKRAHTQPAKPMRFGHRGQGVCTCRAARKKKDGSTAPCGNPGEAFMASSSGAKRVYARAPDPPPSPSRVAARLVEFSAAASREKDGSEHKVFHIVPAV